MESNGMGSHNLNNMTDITSTISRIVEAEVCMCCHDNITIDNVRYNNK